MLNTTNNMAGDAVASVRGGGIIKMTPREWAAIPDNPVQRDTEARAGRARHLRELHPAHAIVHMAILPDGRRYKCDGHTRGFLWQTGQLDAPAELTVHVYLCATIDDVTELYGAFDSQDAVDTASDEMFGAFRMIGAGFESQLLTSRRFKSAMVIASMSLFGDADTRQQDALSLLRYWLPELRLFDSCAPTSGRFKGPLMAAALLTFRRYGDAATSFWSAYAKGHGIKMGDQMDGVQALSDRMMSIEASHQTQGRANQEKIMAAAVSAFERQRSGAYYLVDGSRIKALSKPVMKTWFATAKKTLRSW